MPLQVIGELLESEDGDIARVRSRIEAADRGFDAALADASGWPPTRWGSGSACRWSFERLGELGVISAPAEVFSPSDVQIVEAIARFREGGADETIGFTVYDAQRFIEPLQALARRESSCSRRRSSAACRPTAVSLIEAGIDPLGDLISAMHSRLVATELEARMSSGEGG